MMLHKKITVYFLVGIFFAPILAMNNDKEKYCLVNFLLTEQGGPKEIRHKIERDSLAIDLTTINLPYFRSDNHKIQAAIISSIFFLKEEKKELLNNLLRNGSNLRCSQKTYDQMTMLPQEILSSIPFCWEEGVLVEDEEKKKSLDRGNDLNEILIHAKMGAIFGVPVGIVASVATAGYDCLFAEQMPGLDKGFWIASSCVVGGSAALASVAAKRYLEHEHERSFSNEEVPVRFPYKEGAIYKRKKLCMKPSSFNSYKVNIEKDTNSQEYKKWQRSVLLTE